MSERILKSKGIVKKYGKQEVLHNIDLTLEPGKIYGLIGRNGAGKTTLLSILSAQNPATSGEIYLGEEPVWENPGALEHIFFSREISPNGAADSTGLKVKDYLEMAEAYLTKWDKKMAEELVDLFHLDRKKKTLKLSKGMLSMLSIVLAQVCCPCCPSYWLWPARRTLLFWMSRSLAWTWWHENSSTGFCWRNLLKAEEPL